MRDFSWETFGEWVKTGIVWAVPLALNLRALTRLNPETLIVFRTATLIGVAFGGAAALHYCIMAYQVYIQWQEERARVHWCTVSTRSG